MSTAQRIEPGDRSEVGIAIWALSAGAGRVSGTEPLRLFLTLGRNRKLFWAWVRFARRLMPSGRLPRRVTELVILRVAVLAGCSYELEHHRRLARRSGLSVAEIDRVEDGSASPEWDGSDRLVLSSVESLVSGDDLDDGQWEELHRRFGDEGAIEFVMLVAHYRMLATVVGTLRIRPEGPRRSPSPRSGG